MSTRQKYYFVFLLIIVLVSIQLHAKTWSILVRLTWNSGVSYHPAIARDSGTRIHVVWDDNTSGNIEIYYKRSLNSGTTWSSPKRLTWTAGISTSPSIAVDSTDGVHITWDEGPGGDFEVYYKRSTDGGTTWSSAKRITWFRTQLGNQAGFGAPIIADSGNGIYITWYSYESGNNEVYFKRSSDKGLTWSSQKRLTWNTGWSAWPDIAADINDNIHIVWNDSTPGHHDIFYKSSTDQGVTWSSLKRLTWNIDHSTDAKITADLGGGIHITWTDESPKQTFYKRSPDGGATWSSRSQLTWTSDWSFYQDIAALDTEIHIVWVEEDPNDGNKSQIRYKNSLDTGGSWNSTVQLTWNNNLSFSPSVAVDAIGWVHVVWSDEASGNPEIFYKNHK